MNLARTPLLLERRDRRKKRKAKFIDRLRRGRHRDLPPSQSAATRGDLSPIGALAGSFGGPASVGGIMRHS